MALLRVSYTQNGQGEVGCHANLALVDEGSWPHRLVLASLGGDDSSVKAVAAALCEHREVCLDQIIAPGERYPVRQWLRTDGRHRLLYGKTPEQGHTHAIVLSRRALPGQGDICLDWNGDPAAALYLWLHANTDLPLLPAWSKIILQAATDDGIVKPLSVYAAASSSRLAGLRILRPDLLEPTICQLVQHGALAIPESGEAAGQAGTDSLDGYLGAWGGQLASRAQGAHRPRHTPGEPVHPAIATLAQPLYGPQADVAEGLARTLAEQRTALLVGEMGVGKTRVAAAALHRLYHGRPGYRVLVMCPKHLLAKWPREVSAIIPAAKTAVLRGGADTARLWARRGRAPVGPEWYFIARDAAKLGWYKRCAAIWGEARTPRFAESEIDGQIRHALLGIDREQGWLCPDCGMLQREQDGTPLPQTWLDSPRSDNRTCRGCGGQLWAADHERLHRFAPAEYIHHHLRGFFDALIADEVHELKGGSSAQGQALGSLGASVCRVLALTGTLLGGYASNLHYLAWRLFPAALRQEDLDYHHPAAWVERYGVLERVIRTPAEGAAENRMSRGRAQRVSVHEKPGVSPLVVSRFLLDQAAFLDLADVAPHLPAYREIPEPIEMEPELRAAYKDLEGDLLDAVRKALHTGSKRLLGAYLQTLLGYPDRPWDWPEVTDPLTGEVIGRPKQLPEGEMRPKERRLIEIVRANAATGRGTVIFVQFTGRHDLLAHLEEMLTAQGLRTAVLRADTVAVEEREAWIGAQERRGAQVLLCHPKLVETGLDLIAWPTVVWAQTGYSVYTLRQASRRAWRIGQDRPVQVHYLVYANSMQAAALYLMSRKLDAAEAIEGRLSSEGLRALTAGEDGTLALARMLAGGMGDLRTAEDAWRAAAAEDLPLAAEPATGLRKQTLGDLARFTRVLERSEGRGRGRAYPGQIAFDLDRLLQEH